MLEFLAFITNKKYWYIHSLIVKFVLGIYGIKVGKRFLIEGTPKIKIRGKAQDIIIGNNVTIMGTIDLRNREQGKIIIEDNVRIDHDSRFVAANRAVLRIGSGTGIGPYCIFNAGVDITIGQNCLLAGSIIVQSSDHGFRRGMNIKDQPHTYGEIKIGNDCWLGTNSTVLKGVTLEDGCVVGAKALVKKGHYRSNSVLVGIPARKIKERD